MNLISARGLLLALAVAWLAPRAWSAQPPREAADAFFGKIEALISMKVLRPKPVAKALGVALGTGDAEDADPEDESFRTFTAPASSAAALGKVEIRANRDPKRDAFVIIETPGDLTIDHAVLARRFGSDSAFHTNPPPLFMDHGHLQHRVPAEPQDYSEIYLRNGREIRFVFSGDESRRLKKVVIDRDHIMDWSAPKP